MKYIIDLDALKACLELLPKPVTDRDNYYLVRLKTVKNLIDAFPKEEVESND